MAKLPFVARFLIAPAFLLAGSGLTCAAHASSVTNIAATTAPASAVRVMTIGGSVAHGWNDPEYNGYLHRAFDTLTARYGVTYAVYDKTIVGANAVQLQETLYKGDYEKWLVWIRPQVVVISWGLLNDCLPKTPISQFNQDIGQEIEEALHANAKVFLVTPPVTRASYTQYKTREQAYVDDEVALAKRLNNPNLYVFDVYDQMKQYIADSQLSYGLFSADGWHPNSTGHQLASNLLVQDIQATFGLSAPAVADSSGTTWSSQW